MDPGSSTVLAGGGRDRLSSLGDAALGHILSFLPATEAARTATLSRRWRHVFAAVHTLSFGEAEGPFKMGYDYEWYPCGSCNGDAPVPRVVAGASAALYGRHRGARAATAPLRALRVVFDEYGFRSGIDTTKALDGWLSYAVHGAGEALEIDLRLRTKLICERAYAIGARKRDARNMDMDMDYEVAGGQDDYEVVEGQDNAADDDDDAADADDDAPAADDDDDEPGPVGLDEYVVPRSLFSSCAVLRALRLGHCWIDLPSAIALPSLETLHLTSVWGRRGGGIQVQRLVSACPSLVDLTLEACGDLAELSVHGARLRRLALRCCHWLATVNVGSPELRAFEYRGDIPPLPFLTVHTAPRKLSFCALDFCGEERGAEVFGLLELFAGVERLHLTSSRLGSSFVSHGGGSVFPCFPMLRNLEITGTLPDDDAAAVATVARILEQTPRLETLSLFFLPEPHPVSSRYYVEDLNDASHNLRYSPHAPLAVPHDVVEIPACLRETTKEINLVHYQGSVAQRTLAKFLLCNAPLVDEVCWKVARGPLSIQTKLMEEVRGWVMNKSANMMFF